MGKKLQKVPANFKAKYRIADPSSFFSPASNMVPALSGVSGGRVIIGDKAQIQSMTLVNRQAPLVLPVSKKGEDFTAMFGGLGVVKSNVAGKVHEITDSHIAVKDEHGDVHEHERHDHYLVGRDSFIHHEPVVKVGDTVKKGGLLASSNFSDKDGNLALGMNLKTAVMPYRSHNFEDALVISQSAAHKLEGEQLIPIRLELGHGVEIGKDRYVSMFPNRFYNQQLQHVDSRGVVKPGTTVHHGDPLILAFTPKTLKSLDIQLGKLARVIRNAFTDLAHTWELEYPGVVKDVAVTGTLVTVTVKVNRPMGNADKLSMAFGAKGVVSILPDSKMPTGD